MKPPELLKALRDARNRERNKAWRYPPVLKQHKRKRVLGASVLYAIVRGEGA